MAKILLPLIAMMAIGIVTCHVLLIGRRGPDPFYIQSQPGGVWRGNHTSIPIRELCSLDDVKGDVVILRLGYASITGEHLRKLPQLPNLIELDVSENDISDDSATSIAEFKKLKKLSIRGTRIGDAGAKVLANLPLLEEIDIAETQVGEIGLMALAESKSIKSVFASFLDKIPKGERKSLAKRLTRSNLRITGLE